MKRKAKPIAARFGDYANASLRDVAPDRTPVTFFNEDGSVWIVVDILTRVARTYRRIARQERVDPDLLLSQVFVEQITKRIEEHKRGF